MTLHYDVILNLFSLIDVLKNGRKSNGNVTA